ncbi:hypothetical protein [Segatella oulorum]|uniref:hypothetical protein n=1 Tax=Segatella oulorum TaxID=28136 RepID=UPI0023F4E645|nr:hypothetical protein [Segatella oulorum]
MDCLVKAALLVSKVVQIAWQMAYFCVRGCCAWRLKAGENSVKKGVQCVVEGGMSALMENKISQKVFVMY